VSTVIDPILVNDKCDWFQWNNRSIKQTKDGETNPILLCKIFENVEILLKMILMFKERL